MSDNGTLLTPTEVAAELKLNILTIYKYIRTGDIRAIKFGRTYRISKTDLENFINKKRIN